MEIGVDLARDGDSSWGVHVLLRNGSVIACADSRNLTADEWSDLSSLPYPISRTLKWAQRRHRLKVLRKAKAERKAHDNE